MIAYVVPGGRSFFHHYVLPLYEKIGGKILTDLKSREIAALYADPRDIVPLEYDLWEQLRLVRDPASSLLEAIVEEQRIPAARQLREFDAVVFFDHESMVSEIGPAKKIAMPHGIAEKWFYTSHPGWAQADLLIEYSPVVARHRSQAVKAKRTAVSGFFKFAYTFHQDLPDRDYVLFAPSTIQEVSAIPRFLAYFREKRAERAVLVKLHSHFFSYCPCPWDREDMRRISAEVTDLATLRREEIHLVPNNFLDGKVLFERSACLITDVSSVGYEYLLFDKPLFVIRSENWSSSDLGRRLWKAAYLYADFETLFAEIEEILATDPKRSAREAFRQEWLPIHGEVALRNAAEAIWAIEKA